MFQTFFLFVSSQQKPKKKKKNGHESSDKLKSPTNGKQASVRYSERLFAQTEIKSSLMIVPSSIPVDFT